MSLPDPSTPLRPWLEQAWLQRYLDRELSADEQAWFETYLLSRPQLLDALEVDNALRAVLVAQASGPIRAEASPPPAAAAAPEARTERPLPPSGQRFGGLLALAASFVGGLGLAWLLPQAPQPHSDPQAAIEAPSRVVFDLMRGGPVELREDVGDPLARLMVVDIALPLGSRIASARAELGPRRVELPAAPISGEGFATYTLPRSWRGRAQLHFQLQTESGAALPAVDIAL